MNNKKERIKKDIAYLLLLSSILLPGCGNKAKCEIKQDHAHIYISDEYFNKYLVSEDLTYYDNWVRTDQCLLIDSEEGKLLEFENNNGLYRIDLNRDKLDKITNELVDHLQYRYEYEKIVPDFTKKDISFKVVKLYSWTANPDDKILTGESRVAHFMYHGYKIEEDSNGEYNIVNSGLMESIDELVDNGYNYVTSDFYVLTDPYTKEPLSYEDIDYNVIYKDYDKGTFTPEIVMGSKNNKGKVRVLDKRR